MKTAVAFIIFRRPETTARVFERIRQAKPPRLYIIADGPRPDRPGEAEAVQAARAIVAEDKIDWDCKVERVYSETNLGCRKRVVSGLNKTFKQEDRAIILEDDCLPTFSFFDYCERLLAKFENDSRVFHVGGFKATKGIFDKQTGYFLTRYPSIWGWATWLSAWNKYSTDLTNWKDKPDQYAGFFRTKKEFQFWRNFFADMENKGASTSWDAYWVHTCITNRAFSLRPSTNLVTNLGFGVDSTHTTAPPPKYACSSGKYFTPDDKRRPRLSSKEDQKHFEIRFLHQEPVGRLRQFLRSLKSYLRKE